MSSCKRVDDYFEDDDMANAQEYLLRYAFRLNSGMENNSGMLHSDVQLGYAGIGKPDSIDIVREKIREIPVKYRLPVAFYVSGFAYCDIANRLHLSCATVKYRIETVKRYMQDNSSVTLDV